MLRDLLAAGRRSVALMLTTRCNLRCAYCDQDRTAPQSMPIAVLEAAIRLLIRSDYSKPELILYGGEPLLEKSLVRRAIEIVHSEAPADVYPDVRIFTNGLLLDPETIRLLVDADVHITLSMDGLPGAQDHRGPGSFETLDRMLLRFQSEHPGHFRNRLALQVTLTSANVAYLGSSFRYFVARGVSEIRVSPVTTNDPGWGPASADELDGQLAEVVEESVELQASSGKIPFLAFQSDGNGNSPQAQANSMCGTASRRDLFVDVDGSLAPCAAMAGSSLRKYSPPLLRDAIGTLGTFLLTDPDLEEKLASRERNVAELPLFTGKTAKHSPSARCASCPSLGNCFICPLSIAFATKGMASDCIPAIQCDFNRTLDKHRAVFHSRVRARAPGTAVEPRATA